MYGFLRLLLIIMALLATSGRVSALSCRDVVTKLIPCQSFLVGTAPDVTAPCCQSAESLSKLVGSTPGQLQATCECLKLALAFVGADDDRAKQLPHLCSITTPLPIDPALDCSRLN